MCHALIDSRIQISILSAWNRRGWNPWCQPVPQLQLGQAPPSQLPGKSNSNMNPSPSMKHLLRVTHSPEHP